MKKLPKHQPTLLVVLPLAVILLLVSIKILFTNSQKLSSPMQDTITAKKSLSENQALGLVSSQKTVQDYFRKIPDAKMQIDHFDQDSNSYVIQVFEVKDGHTNTLNWYEVNKESGELKPIFPQFIP